MSGFEGDVDEFYSFFVVNKVGSEHNVWDVEIFWKLVDVFGYQFSLHQAVWRIGVGNLKDGLIRGTKFDRTAEQKLEKLLQDKDPEKIQKACKNLGAEFTETKADLCAVFPVLPRYPVTLKIWFADEEFPVSGKIFLQDHADHYLSVEDAVTVGEILLQKLSEAFSSL